METCQYAADQQPAVDHSLRMFLILLILLFCIAVVVVARFSIKYHQLLQQTVADRPMGPCGSGYSMGIDHPARAEQHPVRAEQQAVPDRTVRAGQQTVADLSMGSQQQQFASHPQLAQKQPESYQLLMQLFMKLAKLLPEQLTQEHERVLRQKLLEFDQSDEQLAINQLQLNELQHKQLHQHLERLRSPQSTVMWEALTHTTYIVAHRR